jgi:hypothetical protein
VRFKIWLEAQNVPSGWKVSLVHVKASTSGSYAYGDHEEVPAENPAKYAKWEWGLKKKESWKLLSGSPALIFDKSGGSYHERWLEIVAAAYVNEALYEQIEQIEGQMAHLSTYDDQRAKKYPFTFTTLKDLQSKLDTIMDDSTYKWGETADQYWARVMGVAASKLGQPKLPSDNYHSGDDYYKK